MGEALESIYEMRAKWKVSLSVHPMHRAICKIRNLEDTRMAFIRPANKLRVLLTGGSGFIGSHVADQFLAHG